MEDESHLEKARELFSCLRETDEFSDAAMVRQTVQYIYRCLTQASKTSAALDPSGYCTREEMDLAIRESAQKANMKSAQVKLDRFSATKVPSKAYIRFFCQGIRDHFDAAVENGMVLPQSLKVMHSRQNVLIAEARGHDSHLSNE